MKQFHRLKLPPLGFQGKFSLRGNWSEFLWYTSVLPCCLHDDSIKIDSYIANNISYFSRMANTQIFYVVIMTLSANLLWSVHLNSSILTYSSRRPLRRIPSIFNESSNQKVIAIPFKPKQRTSKENSKFSMAFTSPLWVSLIRRLQKSGC